MDVPRGPDAPRGCNAHQSRIESAECDVPDHVRLDRVPLRVAQVLEEVAEAEWLDRECVEREGEQVGLVVNLAAHPEHSEVGALAQDLATDDGKCPAIDPVGDGREDDAAEQVPVDAVPQFAWETQEW